MIRKHIWFYEESLDFLETLPGTISEHVRRAITEYIEKIRSINASASVSKRGGSNG